MADKSMDFVMKQKMSCLIDSELTDNEVNSVLDSFDSDIGFKHSWSRYHIISDALHNNLPSHISPELAGRVSAQLKNEPALKPSLANNILKFPSLFKPVIGFALAASVSAIAIISVQNSGGDGVTPMTAVMTVAESRQAVSQTRNFSESNAINYSLEKELEHYLVDHTEYTSTMSVQGALPYVRLVNHVTSQ